MCALYCVKPTAWRRGCADSYRARRPPDHRTRAGVAKGLLYRHFSDFDAFLGALVLSHIEHLDDCCAELRAAAGTATVTDNLAAALADTLTPSAIRIIALTCSRRQLLDRLRMTTPAGVPLLAETTKMLSGYLTAERGLGRVAIDADVDTCAVILVGAAHLLAAGRDGPVDLDDLRVLVATAIDSVIREPSRTPVRRKRARDRL